LGKGFDLIVLAESDLGTPEEDFTSIAALHFLEAPRVLKLLCVLGLGVDHYHGCSSGEFLENTADLTRSNSFLGTIHLLPAMPEFALFRSACEYAFARMETSIVAGSVLHATQGEFGDVKFTNRTGNSALYLNPLMALYWAYELDGVAKANICIDKIKDLASLDQVREKIYLIRELKKKTIRSVGVYPH
jgi:hypothetical protein